MGRDLKYIEAFALLGTTVATHSHMVEILEEFVCHMYGVKSLDGEVPSLNTVRYSMYCQQRGKIANSS